MPRVVHFEIHADDLSRAQQFYETVFGWTFQKWGGPMEYSMINTAGTGDPNCPGINGGMLKRQSPIDGCAVIAYVCTIDVPSVDEFVARALNQGATIAVPKMPIPGVGWLAYCKDTEGNVFGMMQADEAAA